MLAFLTEKILTLGTAACPPYHLAIVIGGTSAELIDEDGEARLHALSRRPADHRQRARPRLPRSRDGGGDPQADAVLGVGAQFGGKYFCHDVRVIRLPRHGASLPIGIGVSCSADRQALGKITRDGVFIEELEHESREISARGR
jgi:fumarate hydratase class I